MFSRSETCLQNLITPYNAYMVQPIMPLMSIMPLMPIWYGNYCLYGTEYVA